MSQDLETMFGVFGDWGRGKTFLIKQIIRELTDSENHYKHEYFNVNYSAWKYQDTPANWAYLYEVLLNKYLDVSVNIPRERKTARFLFAGMKKRQAIFKVNLYRQYQEWINLGRGEWLLKPLLLLGSLMNFPKIILFLALLVLGITLCANLGKSLTSHLESFLALGNNNPFTLILVSIFSVFLFKEPIKRLFEGATFQHAIKLGSIAQLLMKRYGEAKTFQDKPGIQAEINKEIEILLKVWVPNEKEKKVILFVDDLDRCNEAGLIELIDSLRIMLDAEEIRKRLQVIFSWFILLFPC